MTTHLMTEDAAIALLYLLFSEGYHGACPDGAVRTQLCHEAMHLTSLLAFDPRTATPATHALYALMCINAARLPERTDAAGNLKTLFEQDRSRWEVGLVAEGLRHLALSATGTEPTEYHLESAIAALYAAAPSAAETRWAEIARNPQSRRLASCFRSGSAPLRGARKSPPAPTRGSGRSGRRRRHGDSFRAALLRDPEGVRRSELFRLLAPGGQR